MNRMIAGLASLVLGLSFTPAAFAQESPPQPAQPQQYAPAPQQSPPQQYAPAPQQYTPPPPQPAQPAANSWVYSYPSGQWVYSSDRGWIWVPAGASATLVDGVPYTYLYTAGSGWNWYVSPWGFGPYRFGAWARRPWYPPGWRGGWVASPRIRGRLGTPRGFRRFR